MKKYVMWIIVVIVVLAVIIAGILIFFKMTKFQNSGEIVSFEFSESNGWTFSDKYKIYKSGDNVLFENLSFDDGYDESKEPEITIVNPKILSDLTKLVFENKVNSRDGFDKINKHVLDGTSWHLYITFENGDHLSANGYMRHPRKYHEAIEAIMDLIAKVDMNK